MSDRYGNDKQNVYDPIRTVVSISSLASDYTPPSNLGPARAVMVEGTGNLVVEDLTGTEHTYAALATGIWHPMRVARIDSTTSITATLIKLGW